MAKERAAQWARRVDGVQTLRKGFIKTAWADMKVFQLWYKQTLKHGKILSTVIFRFRKRLSQVKIPPTVIFIVIFRLDTDSDKKEDTSTNNIKIHIYIDLDIKLDYS